jgi:hypothetical protein
MNHCCFYLISTTLEKTNQSLAKITHEFLASLAGKKEKI